MKYIIAIWEWLIAFLLFIIFLLWFMVVATIWPYDKYVVWIRSFLKTFFKLLLIRVDVVYESPINLDDNHIYMPNHVSMFDIPLVLSTIPQNFWGIQAASHFKVPLYGWVLKKYGNFPIDRSNARASYKTMMNTVDEIKKGKSILIFPEGTRSTKPSMGSFKKLPFVMVKKANVPIIPMAFIGLWEINNKTSWLIKPQRLKVVFGKEIDRETIESLNEEELKRLTKERIEDLIKSFS